MFEVGFMELALCGVVALLVFGPERLPRVAREAGFWLRKARTTLHSVRQEIEHELEVQDIKNSLTEQKKMLESTLSEKIEIVAPDKTDPKDDKDKVDAQI